MAPPNERRMRPAPEPRHEGRVRLPLTELRVVTAHDDLVLSIPRAFVDALAGEAASEPRRRLAGRRGVSRPCTTRSRTRRFLVPSSSCPDGVSYPDPRAAFAIATQSARRLLPRTSSDQPRGYDDSVTSRVRYPSRMCPPVASGTSSDQTLGCDDSFTSRIRWSSRTCSPAASGTSSDQPLGCDDSVHLAHPVVIEDVLTGCLRDILRPATRVLRLGHFARPVSIEDVSVGRLRDILGPATGLRRLPHLARPVRMTTCSPATFGTASRPSARVYRPC
jgi:hypothetical protein